MKYQSFLFVSLALLALSSCADNIELVKSVIPGQELTFEATFGDEPDTKTVVQSDGTSIWWRAHEDINIFYGDSESSKFTSTNDEPVAKAKFTGSIEGFTGVTETGEANSFWAIYPYDEANTCDGSSITATLPGYQTGKAETFSDKQWMTMAKSHGLALSFYAVGAGFRFSVTKSGVTSVVFKGNNNEVLAGKAKIGMDANNRPIVQEHLTEVKEIILSAPEGESFEIGKLYYLAFYPANFTKGFTITFNTATETGTRVYDSAIDFKRTDVHKGKNFDQNVEYGPNIQPTVIFADDNFKAYCVEHFDLDKDGEISETEANAITVIDVCTDEITSVRGIEKMPNLVSLSCIGSPLSEFAATGIVQKGKLESLDISKNTALRSLDCRNNRITAIDVSKNTALERFNCNNNEIHNLNVASNTKIEVLHFACNPISSIDLTKLQELEALECNYTFLNSLDVSQNPLLKHLWCNNSDLRILDLTHNSVLDKLGCVGNPFLSIVWMSVSQNLSYLYYDPDITTVRYNSIIAFEDADFKAYCVANFDYDGDGNISAMEAWSVRSINVCTDNISSLQGIEYFTELTSLICEGTSTEGSSNGILAQLNVSHNTKLSRLDCNNNLLTSLVVLNNTMLTRLSCSSNKLSSLDVSNNTLLTKLFCERNQMTSIDVSHNNILEELMCGANHLENLDVSKNSKLTVLDCDLTHLTSLDVSKNTELAILVCRNNSMTSLDVSKNTELIILECGSNKLSTLDVSHNPKLNYLYCYSNRLRSLDVSCNTELGTLMCQSNPLLTEIWLKTGQVITSFVYDTEVATIKYK